MATTATTNIAAKLPLLLNYLGTKAIRKGLIMALAVLDIHTVNNSKQ